MWSSQWRSSLVLPVPPGAMNWMMRVVVFVVGGVGRDARFCVSTVVGVVPDHALFSNCSSAERPKKPPLTVGRRSEWMCSGVVGSLEITAGNSDWTGCSTRIIGLTVITGATVLVLTGGITSSFLRDITHSCLMSQPNTAIVPATSIEYKVASPSVRSCTHAWKQVSDS